MYLICLLIAIYLGSLAWKGLLYQHKQEVKRYQRSINRKFTDDELKAIFDKYKDPK